MALLYRKAKIDKGAGTMETNRVIELLKKMLKEQLCCQGRVFARHDVPDDVIWEVW